MRRRFVSSYQSCAAVTLRLGAFVILGPMVAFASMPCACRSPANEGGGGAVPSSDEERAVLAVADSWDPMLNSANLDGLIGLLAEDVVRMDPGAPPTVGREAVRDEFRTAFDNVIFHASDPAEEVHVDGDWGFAFGAYQDRLTDKRTRAAMEDIGKWVSVFRRTPDGWKYAVDIWNRDTRAAGFRRSPDESAAPAAPDRPEKSGFDADSREVQAAVSTWDERYNAGDVEPLSGMYASNAHRMNDGEPERVGRGEIRDGLRDELGIASFDEHTAIHGLVAEGEWAYAWGTWSQRRTDKETQEKSTERGNWLFVFRRTSDGWKIYVDIWNRSA